MWPPFTPVVYIQSSQSQPSLPRAATAGEVGGAVGGGRGWNDLHNKILTTQPQDTALLGGEPQYLYTTLYFRSLRCRAGSEDNNTPSSGTNVTNIINIFIAL